MEFVDDSLMSATQHRFQSSHWSHRQSVRTIWRKTFMLWWRRRGIEGAHSDSLHLFFIHVGKNCNPHSVSLLALACRLLAFGGSATVDAIAIFILLSFPFLVRILLCTYMCMACADKECVSKVSPNVLTLKNGIKAAAKE